MLHYESSLVRLFRTIFYSLPLTLGITEEKQKVELNFFDDYIDDSVSQYCHANLPCVNALVLYSLVHQGSSLEFKKKGLPVH